MGLQIFATGVSITTSATSANATIPNSSAGVLPRYIRISATANAFVRIGSGAQTAVATDMLVQPAESVILAVNGNNNIAAIQQLAAGIVQVSPVEDL